MAQIHVSNILVNLDDDVRDKLLARAQRHGRSVAEEVRDILHASVHDAEAPPTRLGTWCREQFNEAGEEPFEIPEWRGGDSQPLRFD